MLSTFVDLNAAVSAGFLVSWYPVHASHRLPELKAKWGHPKLLLDISFVQPALTLHAYFGSRLAFIFCWTGFYCKAMLALLPLALIAFAISYVLQYVLYTSGVKVVVLAFNIIIVLWSR